MATNDNEMERLIHSTGQYVNSEPRSGRQWAEGSESHNATYSNIPISDLPRLKTAEPITKNDQSKVQVPKTYSLASRLGKTAISVLISTSLAIAGVLGFISFLWYGDASNTVWHTIVSRGWMSRAVTLSSLSLRSAVSAQAVILTSMLAGLFLERHRALASELAALSQMRGTNSGPIELSQLNVKTVHKTGLRWKTLYLPILTTLLLAVSIAIQISSTLLISDLGQAAISKRSVEYDSQTSFSWGLLKYGVTSKSLILPRFRRSSAWLHNPTFFPTFAEYTENSTKTDDSVSDTGTVLRAYLPLSAEGARNKIQRYVGQATVVDARVVCVRPDILNPQAFWDTPDPSFPDEHYVRIEGETAVSANPEGFQSNATTNRTRPYVVTSTTFSCFSQPNDEERRYWKLSICQVYQPGGLMSAFGQIGQAYLVLNISQAEWNVTLRANDTRSGTEPQSMTARGIWRDLNFVNVTKASNLHFPWQLSLSLCFTAFDSADLKIDAHSEVNRTEPIRSFDHDIRRPSYGNVLYQLGYNTDGTRSQNNHAKRGILQLEKASTWNPNDAVGSNPRPLLNQTTKNTQTPYWPILSPLVNSAKFEGASSPLKAPVTNYTAFLHMTNAGGRILNQGYDKFTWNETTGTASGPRSAGFITPDAAYSLLAQQMVKQGSSIPNMLSSLFTILAGSIYYDQLDEFDLNTTTQQAVFVNNLAPLRHSGYTAVAIIVIVHVILTSIIITLFAFLTTISTIGNSWQNAAQLLDPSTERLLRGGQLLRDQDIHRITKRRETGLEQHESLLKDMTSISTSTSTSTPTTAALQPDELVAITLNSDGTGTQIVRSRKPVPVKDLT